MTFVPAPPDPPEIEAILWDGFSNGRLAFDIGANAGQTIPILRSRYDLVVALEPAQECIPYLKEHYASDSVYIIDQAVSDGPTHIDLTAAPSKISTGQLVTHGTEGMEWSADEMENGEIRTVIATTLDRLSDYYGRPSFVKIDVEGHELAVLRGGPYTTANKDRPEMLIEIHSEQLGLQIIELLHTGYELEAVRHPHYEEGSTLWKTHFWLRCFPRGR